MAYYGKTGGIIAAASKRDAVPLLQVGSIPIIRRLVIVLQQAGVFPLVIVTGTEEAEVIHQLAQYGVIFLRNRQCDAPELLDSVKLGLRFLRDKCDRVVFTPVNTPMFSPETLRAVLACDAPIVTPSYHGKSGHPIVLRNDALDTVLTYSGENGLRGALASAPALRRWTEVEDRGILLSVHDQQQLREHLKEHNRSLLSPTIQVGIEKEGVFFNSRLKLLLFLIADLSSVRQACFHMGLSPAKAWGMLNQLEQEVGYAVIDRQHGGSRGGRTTLTPRGLALVRAYQQYEDLLHSYAHDTFTRMFRDSGLI